MQRSVCNLMWEFLNSVHGTTVNNNMYHILNSKFAGSV